MTMIKVWDDFFDKIVIEVRNNLADIHTLRNEASTIPGLRELMLRHKQLPTVNNINAANFLTWLTNKLTQKTINNSHEVVGLFFLVSLISEPAIFWKNICLEQNISTFLSTAKKLLLSAKTTISSRTTPFHEEEMKLRLENIITDKNWETIYSEFHRGSEAFKYKIGFAIHNVFYLMKACEYDGLLDTLNKIEDIPLLWGILDLNKGEDALDIALVSDSQYVQFCALATVLPFNGTHNKSFSDEKLTSVFLKFSHDLLFFSHWMAILNTYPTRYPHIQKSLGKALALSNSIAVIELYFQSIQLHKLDGSEINDSRKSVSICLETFTQYAAPDLRHQSWQLAYKKWKAWGFDINKKSNFLNKIMLCEIDYAITMYYTECCNTQQRNIEEEAIIARLDTFISTWFSSSTEMTSYWFIQLSLLQPIYQAMNVIQNPERPVLMQGNMFIPTKFHDNKYFDLMLAV